LIAISPGVPIGTSLPASSMSFMSVFGMGMPMLPLKEVLSTGLQLTEGDVSDRP
jgi:hypothetical protein